jgi:hypothetical protein
MIRPLLALFIWFGLAMASPPSIPSAPHKEPTKRELIIKTAEKEVGVVEKTGKNDGEVEKYLVAVGLPAKSGAPYCAAFVYWVGKAALGAANPYPKSAWSPDMVAGGKTVTENTEIKGGEAFGIYFASKKRIAHTGLVKAKQGAYLITVEGNTSSTAAVGSSQDRDGQGVYSKRRHWKTVKMVKDWVKN